MSAAIWLYFIYKVLVTLQSLTGEEVGMVHQQESELGHQLPVESAGEQGLHARIVAMSKALSDPIRVRMVRLLSEGRERLGLPSVRALHVPGPDDVDGICVNEFQEAFRLGQSKVSYHLRILREAGLVTEESRGKWSFYSLNREAARELIDRLHSYFRL